MNTDTHDLELSTAAASATMDFEEARHLRDQINLIRGASPEDAARADTWGADAAKIGRNGDRHEPTDTSQIGRMEAAGQTRDLTAAHSPRGKR